MLLTGDPLLELESPAVLGHLCRNAVVWSSTGTLGQALHRDMTHLDAHLGQQSRLIHVKVPHTLHRVAQQTDAHAVHKPRHARSIAPRPDLSQHALVQIVSGDQVKRAPRAQEHIRQVLHAVHTVVLGRFLAGGLGCDSIQPLSVEDQNGQMCVQQRGQGDVAGCIGQQDDDDQILSANLKPRHSTSHLIARVTHPGEFHVSKRQAHVHQFLGKLCHLGLEFGILVVQLEHQSQQTDFGHLALAHHCPPL